MIGQATRTWRRLDDAAGGLALDLLLYLLSAGFAGITAATSTLPSHRAWGSLAVWGYLAGVLVTLLMLATRTHRATVRAAVTVGVWVAAALVPLVIQAAQRVAGRSGRAQEEVVVIEEAGRRLLDTGTPYLDRAAIAALPEPLLGYLPYQPGMALFGWPRAAFGEAVWTDARVWFAVVTAGALVAALRLARRAGARSGTLVRAAQVVTVLPICALTLATGGDDLPVLVLCLLALAFTARDRPGAAGLAIGVAGALKLFAWPVAVVLAIHALRRRQGARLLVGTLGVPVLALLPAVLVDPGAAVENVLAFPLGRGLVDSPARSPLPGHLIATLLPAGRAIPAALLVLGALALAVGIRRRPPRDAAEVARWSGYGLLVAMLLMPATRFGYLLYPAALLVWAVTLTPVRREVAAPAVVDTHLPTIGHQGGPPDVERVAAEPLP